MKEESKSCATGNRSTQRNVALAVVVGSDFVVVNSAALLSPAEGGERAVPLMTCFALSYFSGRFQQLGWRFLRLLGD